MVAYNQQISIFDLGFDKFLSRELSPLGNNDMLMPSYLGSDFYETSPGQIGSGELGQNISLVDGYLQSSNFVTGSAGWRIDSDGNVEFESGYFRGDISGATGTFTGGIAVGTSPNWFKVDADGNIWSGSATLAGAKTDSFAVEKEGLLYCKGATIDGTSTIGGRVSSTLAGAIDASGHFADDAINTAEDTILSSFTFGESGALQIGTYESGVTGDIKISPSGILGRDKTGATTFSINATTGVAVLNGLVVGTNVGLGTAQDSAGVTTIIGDTVITSFVNALNITALGAVTSGSFAIGSNAWHVDSSGNMWWGNFETYASATYKISTLGVANLSGIIAASVAAENITGTYITGKTIRTADPSAGGGSTALVLDPGGGYGDRAMWYYLGTKVATINSTSSVILSIQAHEALGQVWIGNSNSGWSFMCAGNLNYSKHIYPYATNTYYLGLTTHRWAGFYLENLIDFGSSVASIQQAGSTMLQFNHSSGYILVDENLLPNSTYNLGSSGNKWANLYLSGNITVGGTVDGVDISAHAGNASAHHSSTSNGLTITPSKVQASYTGTGTSAGIKGYNMCLTNGRIYMGSTLAINLYSSSVDMELPMRLKNLSSAPSGASDGWIFYNTTYDEVWVYIDGSWEALAPKNWVTNNFVAS